jgi:hypothetical protein
VTLSLELVTLKLSTNGSHPSAWPRLTLKYFTTTILWDFEGTELMPSRIVIFRLGDRVRILLLHRIFQEQTRKYGRVVVNDE